MADHWTHWICISWWNQTMTPLIKGQKSKKRWRNSSALPLLRTKAVDKWHKTQCSKRRRLFASEFAPILRVEVPFNFSTLVHLFTRFNNLFILLKLKGKYKLFSCVLRSLNSGALNWWPCPPLLLMIHEFSVLYIYILLGIKWKTSLSET